MMDTVTYQAGTSGLVGAGLLDTLRISPGDGLAIIFQGVVMYGCIALLLVLACIALVCVCRRALVIARRVLGPGELVAFAIAAGVCCWAAQKRLVSYPRTDPTTAYLVDSGSWVDSETDIVHIDFTRIIVPDSAMLYVDRLGLSEGDESWENQYAATFGETGLPLEITCQNATNYRWIVYTDWTPGPAVQTNGVWHANWGLDRRARKFLIPLRTAVRVDGETIATPKSKEDAHEHQ